MTRTFCDLLFVKWAVNSGGITLRHPVLWRFVSVPFPMKAVVKSHHMISWVMKQSVCFFVFVSPLRQTSHVGIFKPVESGSEGSYWSLHGGGSGSRLKSACTVQTLGGRWSDSGTNKSTRRQTNKSKRQETIAHHALKWIQVLPDWSEEITGDKYRIITCSYLLFSNSVCAVLQKQPEARLGWRLLLHFVWKAESLFKAGLHYHLVYPGL